MLVAPEHRPTLQEELKGLPSRSRWVAIAILALLVLAAAVLLLRGSTEDGTRTVVREPIAFNLRYPDSMQRVEDDTLFHLQREGKDDFIVEPLELPAYEGDVGGVLPIEASREIDRLKERFPDLEPVEEGKVRINRVAGYSLAFRASRKPRLYGRVVLLPEPVPGARTGVKLLLLATPGGGANKARDVGTTGELKTPYRSFRFGTEGP
ncbi:hypothetical protein OJ997_23640 [Solirubrobacter phytolaccae]|uniref:Uncharacterized protein n=1 Tax=Solirubrobacter phytolaccae TaxID=1404360 RepID=A0A9X3NBI2_9ACTN|nr:hypothetical protein [Solirubrobacter phytolaccae]MDA0183323.1 hypothetical protein [Solirubrobacter phytolaccae]